MKPNYSYSFYLGEIKVKVQLTGILSQKADACVVPQCSTGIALNGPSGALVHSNAQDGIVDFQKILRKKKPLPFGTAYITECKHRNSNYHYLLHIPVLDCKDKEKIQEAISVALNMASDVDARTVVIPSIDGNKNHFKTEEMARVTFAAINDLSNQNTSLKELILAAQTKDIFKNYKNFFQSQK